MLPLRESSKGRTSMRRIVLGDEAEDQLWRTQGSRIQTQILTKREASNGKNILNARSDEIVSSVDLIVLPKSIPQFHMPNDDWFTSLMCELCCKICMLKDSRLENQLLIYNKVIIIEVIIIVHIHIRTSKANYSLCKSQMG